MVQKDTVGSEASRRAGRGAGAGCVHMDAVGAAMVVYDPSGRVTDLNQRAADLLRIDRTQAVGRTASNAADWADTVLTEGGAPLDIASSDLLAAARRGERSETAVFGLSWEDRATTVWVQVTNESLRTPSGDLEAVVATLVDVSRLKAARDHLRDTTQTEDALRESPAVLVDRTEQKRTDKRMEHLLLHDTVTGLANRSLFVERAGQALKHAQRKRLAFAVAILQLDRFDALASSLGHEGADQLLFEVGRRLQHSVRAEDTLAHLGGGEFAALLPGAAGPMESTAAVSKLLAAVGEPVQVGAHELFLTLGLGVAIFPTDGVTAAELLKNAGVAMRRAADEGGVRWQFFHASMNAERADRLELDAELHRALDAGQFFLEYQPVVDAHSGEIVSVEALIRWRHPERGVVPPLEFVPLAEESGVLIPIGAWVLGEACRQGRAWHRQFGRPLRMGVNISARQLHDESLVGTVRKVLRGTGFDPRSLELEITETAAMRDARHTAQILGALRAMGVGVALDDFGTGYSSLSHLVRLPISTVKIDRSFVRDLQAVPEHAAVVASVIALGRRLDLRVVAEGVETIGERGALRDEGCDAIQGFLYSRPVPAEACAELLEAGRIEV